MNGLLVWNPVLPNSEIFISDGGSDWTHEETVRSMPADWPNLWDWHEACVKGRVVSRYASFTDVTVSMWLEMETSLRRIYLPCEGLFAFSGFGLMVGDSTLATVKKGDPSRTFYRFPKCVFGTRPLFSRSSILWAKKLL